MTVMVFYAIGDIVILQVNKLWQENAELILSEAQTVKLSPNEI